MYGVSLILHTENWAMTSVGWLSSETQTISLSSPQHQPSSFGLCSKSCPQLNIVTVFSPRKSMCLIKNPGIPDIKYARNFAILIPASVNTGSLLKKKKKHHIQLPRFSANSVNMHFHSMWDGCLLHVGWITSPLSFNFSACEICHMDSSEEWSPSLTCNSSKVTLSITVSLI